MATQHTQPPPAAGGLDELRNTVSECWRILRYRWRMALVGACIASSAAFWYSQYLPREYVATTVFERRDDVVLRNLVSSNSPYGFEHLKTTLTTDMVGSRALARAAVRAGFLRPESCPGEGALSPEERAALDGVLGRFNLRTQVAFLQSSPALDTISLQCNANDPVVARQFVTAVRESYIAFTRERIHRILSSTKSFFEAEVARLGQEVAESQRELRAGFDEFPGLDPSDVSGVGTRLESLRFQRDALAQRCSELQAQIAAREQFQQAAPELYAGFGAAPAPTTAPAPGTSAGLDRSIEEARTQLVELFLSRRMTNEHPEVKRLRARLSILEELRETMGQRAEDAATDAEMVGSALIPAEWRVQQLRVNLELDALRSQLQAATARLEEADAKTHQFEKLYERLLGGGEQQRKLQERRSKAANELALWQSHLTQLERALMVESVDRGTQFGLIEDAKDSPAPVKPRLASIFLIGSGLGLAAAALLIALAELFDRSFRSLGHVTRALGVPVLECISVIATPRERRRQFLRRLIWTPILTAMLLCLTGSAGLAYTSLARPDLHRRAMQKLNRLLQATATFVQPAASGGVAAANQGDLWAQ